MWCSPGVEGGLDAAVGVLSASVGMSPASVDMLPASVGTPPVHLTGNGPGIPSFDGGIYGNLPFASLDASGSKRFEDVDISIPSAPLGMPSSSADTPLLSVDFPFLNISGEAPTTPSVGREISDDLTSGADVGLTGPNMDVKVGASVSLGVGLAAGVATAVGAAAVGLGLPVINLSAAGIPPGDLAVNLSTHDMSSGDQNANVYAPEVPSVDGKAPKKSLLGISPRKNSSKGAVDVSGKRLLGMLPLMLKKGLRWLNLSKYRREPRRFIIFLAQTLI